MCGIAGLLELAGRPVHPGMLEGMGRTLRHRGPDDSGVYVDGAIGLANVRLAVIDTSSAGHQPMSSADGRYVIVYNGELYNFRDLATELADRGHSFDSRTDTEVALRAYEEWGPACLDRFNGMFAFAIWDSHQGSFSSLAIGWGSSLYYTQIGGMFAFGSEVKALLSAGYRAQVSPVGLSEYFTFQNILSDATLFEGVRMLGAGHYLQIGQGDSAPRLTRYWDLDFRPEESVSADEWVKEVRAAFENAVVRQLVSDVPIGSYLSGGVDSSSIALVATRSTPRLMTFTGGFDMKSVTGFETVFDERADAEAIARLGPTEHYTMVMHSGDMAWVLPELVWHLEDLRLGMAYQNHYMARLASKFVTVALAGTGGDIFAGYPWRYTAGRGCTRSGGVRTAALWLLDASRGRLRQAGVLLSGDLGEHSARGATRGVPECDLANSPSRSGDTRVVLRGKDLSPRPPRGRGSRFDGEQPRSTRSVP